MAYDLTEVCAQNDVMRRSSNCKTLPVEMER